MPTYTYRCTKCGDEIETFQSMSDPPLKRCKKCRGALRRTFHPVGIVLKGSGFYKTDHRSKSSSGSSKKDSGESTSESKKDSTSTKDSKAPSKSSDSGSGTSSDS